jgi:hypothetical protein
LEVNTVSETKENELSADDKVLLEILDKNVEGVTSSLDGLTPEALSKLLAAEQAGKTRKGVISALEALLAPDEPVVSGEFDAPTVAEARVMFDDRVGLAQVLTVEGLLNRDGSFASPPVEKRLTLDGTWVAK